MTMAKRHWISPNITGRVASLSGFQRGYVPTVGDLPDQALQQTAAAILVLRDIKALMPTKGVFYDATVSCVCHPGGACHRDGRDFVTTACWCGPAGKERWRRVTSRITVRGHRGTLRPAGPSD